jgi:hypothetical protein
MSVTANDIVIYGAVSRAENDSDAHGGDILTSSRYIFGDAALANSPAASGGDGTLRYLSTNDADNGVDVTVYGRNLGGSLVNETRTLANSGVVQTGTQVFERIMKVVVDAHDYDVEVKDSASNELVTIESGVLEVRRPFYNASSDPNAEKTYYEKVFVKNNHSVLNLLGTTFIDGGGDSNNYVTFAIASEINSTETLTNRLTPPTGTGVGGFSKTTKTLDDETGSEDLDAGDAAAVFLKMTLPQNAVAGRDVWVLQVSGSTI